MEVETTPNLMSLPTEMIYKILSYLSYDQTAKLRAVNRTFNNICSDRLNKGFIHLEQFHNKCLKAVKSKLPRRESERKHHPLARHTDILMAIETRLSMLSMTYTKYIEERQCCFIPGKVLDEALKVLHIISKSSNGPVPNTPHPILPRPHDFLQEYRDISSMAMEHFDDKILPSIREKMKLGNPRLMGLKNRQGNDSFARSSLLPDGPRPMLFANYGPCVRNYVLGMQSRKSTASKCAIGGSAPSSSRLSALRTNSGDNNAQTLPDGDVTLPVTRLFKMLRNTKEKCNSTRKAVEVFNQSLKFSTDKWKLQNSILRRKINQQRATIKVMRRQLKETKHAVSLMSKDLTILKLAQSTAKAGAQAVPDQPACSNLSVTMTSSLSCPVNDEPSTSSESKGIKRKLDCPEEHIFQR